MEAINQLLKPQWLFLKNLTIALSYVKMLRGVSLVFQETSQPLSDTDSVEQLLSALVYATLSMRLAQQRGDHTLMTVNGISLLVNLGVLVFNYCFTMSCKRSRIWDKMLLIFLLIVASLCYSTINEPEMVKRHFSILMTIIESVMIVKDLLKQSCDVVGGFLSTLVSLSKLLYTLSRKNSFMWYQHLVVLFLNLLRLKFSLKDGHCERTSAALSTSLQQQVDCKISSKSISKNMIGKME